ncbi:MAG TPA: hypothetical protein PK529_06665 [Verrucomicrobiales bacterium]|nr:hypothetical protein [Verrucomicrobiales bacterium]
MPASIAADAGGESPGCLYLLLYFSLLLLAISFHHSIIQGRSLLTGLIVAGWCMKKV